MSATTQQVSNAEQVRDRVHRMWGTVAASWGEHADEVEERAAVVTRTMIDAVGPVAGDEVLELACGAGGLGLAIAEMVSPGGRVVLSDVAPEMVAIAARRAEAAGLRNVAPKVIDLERIAEPDAAHDAVLCREGLMFVPDPAAAAGEIARVLRPGGRVVMIGATPPAGLGAILARGATAPPFVSSGEAAQALDANGFRSARIIGEREGLAFVEAIKPRDT
jgi:ubiquinone/menaquinone biosynthesis C-methylase UbiE